MCAFALAFALVLLRLVRRALVSQTASDLPKSYRGHDEPSRPLLLPHQAVVIFYCLALIGSNGGPPDPWHWSLKLVAQLFRVLGGRSVRSLHFHGPETIKKESGSATVFYVCFRRIFSLAIFCFRIVPETPTSAGGLHFGARTVPWSRRLAPIRFPAGATRQIAGARAGAPGMVNLGLA